MQSAIDLAHERVRDGLPLRAPIAVVGYVARKPATARERMRAGVEAASKRRPDDRPVDRRRVRASSPSPSRPPTRSACTTTTSRRSATS